MKKKQWSESLLNHKTSAFLTAAFLLGIVTVSEAQIRAPRPGVFRRPGKVVPVSVQPAPVQTPLRPSDDAAKHDSPVAQKPAEPLKVSEKDSASKMDSGEAVKMLAPAEKTEKKSVARQDSDILSEKELLNEAVDEVLEKSDNPEELAPVLRKVESDQIQKAVDEAIKETEEDQKNETINGIVEESLTEVDEDAIEDSVNQVLEDSVQFNQEVNPDNSANKNEELEDILPGSVEQVLNEAELRRKANTEAPANLNSEPAAEATLESEPEPAAEAALESEPESAAEATLESEPEPAAEATLESEPEPAAEATLESEPESAAEETELQPMTADFETVKLADMDKALVIPEDADFERLTELFLKIDRIRPADLNSEDAKVTEEQVKDFLLKTFTAKLSIAEKMLAFTDLTEEQWETAVSLKVQVLANLFRLEPSSVETMRRFVKEIEPCASKSLLWNVEAVLIQMELCQFQTEPAPEELKECVVRMLAHLKSGIEQNCLNKDFALSTVQMVILTEDKLPEEEYLKIFKTAIQVLNISEDEGLKETAKLLVNILKQKDLVGQPVDISLTTYDGKTVKTADYSGKTLLFYCFSFENQNDLRDLSLIYQFFMAYQARGFEVIGIVSGEKKDEMDQLLKQIPWPMVFEKPDSENSVLDYFAISVLPAKVLINADGKIEKANVDAATLMKYLEQTYGPVVPEEKDVEETDEDSVENETETPEVKELEDVVEKNADFEISETSENLKMDAKRTEKTESSVNSKEDAKEKTETEKEEPELDLDLDL